MKRKYTDSLVKEKVPGTVISMGRNNSKIYFMCLFFCFCFSNIEVTFTRKEKTFKH